MPESPKFAEKFCIFHQRYFGEPSDFIERSASTKESVVAEAHAQKSTGVVGKMSRLIGKRGAYWECGSEKNRRLPVDRAARQRFVQGNRLAPRNRRAGTKRYRSTNLGKVCNLTCVHCHVNAGPKRKES